MTQRCALGLPRHLVWQGAPIVTACTAQAAWGQWLLLTAEGGLHGMDLDSGRSQQLAQLELPAPTPPRPYWPHGFQLHCAPSGGYAVVADNGGSFGLLVNLGTGQVVAQLHGGDYHPHTVPFSIAFTQHQGRDVLIHRTDWNRLDAMDCATGANLTARDGTQYEQPHYLDYFHGGLLLSPSGEHVLDDGWVWAPVGVPTVWSLPAWLEGNPWESEDGPTRRWLAQGEGWAEPCVWLDDGRIAIWNLGNWEEDGFGDGGHVPGVTVFDIHAPRPEDGHGGTAWPMPELPRAQHLHCMDGVLCVVAEGQSWLWDVATQALLAQVPGFAPQGLHRERGELLQWSAQGVEIRQVLGGGKAR
ncbi:MAG: hypothetical protein LBE51_01685 [Acidovorax sp.]|jgi:hypothetical protein|nr:hypothetical protein [Acidovorax sp.]